MLLKYLRIVKHSRKITNWVLKFADDTKIFGPVCNQSDYMKFQEDLN